VQPSRDKAVRPSVRQWREMQSLGIAIKSPPTAIDSSPERARAATPRPPATPVVADWRWCRFRTGAACRFVKAGSSPYVPSRQC